MKKMKKVDKNDRKMKKLHTYPMYTLPIKNPNNPAAIAETRGSAIDQNTHRSGRQTAKK